MTEASGSQQSPALGSAAPSHAVPLMNRAGPGSYVSLALANPEEMAELAQLADQLLKDPLALQCLSDRVLELLKQELKQQQERSHGYGRRG